MGKTIRVGIVGYGNVGRGVEQALLNHEGVALAAVFTRRDPAGLKLATPGVPVVAMAEVENWKDKIDVMILCGGSATDLPQQGPELAKMFTTVDSFDTHAKIPEYAAAMDKAGKEGGHVAMISIGWDPGLFSMQRLLAGCALPQGNDYTFWGRGVSQGHSDAVRRVPGVKNAIQYTVPIPEAVEAVRSGANPQLTTRQKHLRECYVVAEEGADRAEIERAIKEMPNYFADYDTTVTFITEEELRRDHGEMPHAGFVFRTGTTGTQTKHTQVIEYALKLDSNPEFTASVLVAFARAAYRLAQEGKSGCYTAFDVPLSYLSPKGRDELLATLL